MQIPDNFRYTATHEWISPPADGVVTVGVTDYAQDQLGDVVYVELPDIGAQVSAGDPVAVVESVKTASDIYTPVTGTVEAVNDDLEEAPERINESPFDAGWLFRVRLQDASELDALLDSGGYLRAVETEG